MFMKSVIHYRKAISTTVL